MAAVDVPMVFVMRHIVQNHLKNKSFLKKTTRPTINGVGFFVSYLHFKSLLGSFFMGDYGARVVA